ncbi:YwqG family protein [Streptomyces cinnamoneus]|uniref:YwqG family protein n=1 Tax=Streptomyces cinnamoneus TaxID=53446 RepID=UPI003428C72B
MTQSAISSPLHDLARTHLPSDMAERWIGLLRPGAHLAKAADGEAVAGRLGGVPALPEGEEWPAWEGHGPLSFVAAVDCAALPVGELDIPLPADGTLSFFYFDGQIDDGDALVLPDDPETWAGARVVYVPAGVEVAERAVPEGLEAYPEVLLTARVGPTALDPWHPDLEAACRGLGDLDPLRDDDFNEALHEAAADAAHHIGGHAWSIQNPVESEVAHAVLGGREVPWNDPRIEEEARRWTLLAQFGSDDDADMMWGDCGSLYWLIRPEDLADRRFDRAMFNWQCS